MGRIVLGIGFLGVLVGGAVYLAILMSGSDAVVEEVSAVPAVDGLDYVDPACLWPVLDAALLPDAAPAPDSVPVHGCAPEGTLIHDEDGWVRIVLEGNLPDGDDAPRRTGARISFAGDDSHLVLETYDNWGGTGVFSTLLLGRLTSDGAHLMSLSAHPFGDRCNGGLAGTTGPDGELRITANMTPWDILISPLIGLDDEVQWAVGEQRFGTAFLETPFCAVCCSAVTREYSVDVAAGTISELGLRYNEQVPSSMPDNPLVSCLEDAVGHAAGPDALVAGAEVAVLSQAITDCAEAANSAPVLPSPAGRGEPE
ncbi:MAG: hypothetical protein COA62_10210 [Rhodobiaceae bacterium]|nr:MAG: hypothetical protein COA62_10210 [Rhodobiaceae bacterium]